MDELISSESKYGKRVVGQKLIIASLSNQRRLWCNYKAFDFILRKGRYICLIVDSHMTDEFLKGLFLMIELILLVLFLKEKLIEILLSKFVSELFDLVV